MSRKILTNVIMGGLLATAAACIPVYAGVSAEDLPEWQADHGIVTGIQVQVQTAKGPKSYTLKEGTTINDVKKGSHVVVMTHHKKGMPMDDQKQEEADVILPTVRAAPGHAG